jgi:hypothetical protein
LLTSVFVFFFGYLIIHIILHLHSFRGQTNEFNQQPAINKDSRYQNAALLDKAWQQPAAKSYSLNPVVYQPRPGHCGLASFNNVLNSMSIFI